MPPTWHALEVAALKLAVLRVPAVWDVSPPLVVIDPAFEILKRLEGPPKYSNKSAADPLGA